MSTMPVRLLFVFALALVAGACGDDAPEDYSAETREAFMQGCVEDDSDENLVEVCECTYEAAEDTLPFERFRSIERRLQQGSSDVPDDVAALIVDCIREVSARRS